MRGLKEGTRSGLFFEMVRLLAGKKEEDRPRWLLIENVKNLLSIDRGFGFLRLLIELEQVGYLCEWSVLNSADFGVPQHRERVFIIGHLRGTSRRAVFPLSRADGKNPAEYEEPDIKILGNYSPSNYSASRIVSADGIAPTVMENHGTVTATVVKCNRDTDITVIGSTQKNATIKNDGICPTLTEAMGMGGGHVPMITLTSQDRHGVVIQFTRNGDIKETDVANTLTANDSSRSLGNHNPITGVVYESIENETDTCSNMPKVIGGIGKPNDFGKQFRQGNRIYSVDGVAPALQSSSGNASGGSVLIAENETDTDSDEI